MGKSYSYSIVVEQNDQLLINDQEIRLPSDVAEREVDPLEWALEQVQQTFADFYAEDDTSDLSLTVRDLRPNGLARRAKFSHPDSGINLESFKGERSPHSKTASRPPEATEPQPELNTPESQKEEASEAFQDHIGPQESASEAVTESSAEQPASNHTPGSVDSLAQTSAAGSSSSDVAVVTSQQVAESEQPLTYEQRMAQERGWRKLDKEKTTRPQIGSAENQGRSKRAGLLAEAKKQKVLLIVGAIVAVVLLIAGVRALNGGSEHEALCVDQRTMTRAVSGVACENEEETNHRWWYVPSDAERIPAPGDSIDPHNGTFDEPTGSRDTITRHVESEE